MMRVRGNGASTATPTNGSTSAPSSLAPESAAPREHGGEYVVRGEEHEDEDGRPSFGYALLEYLDTDRGHQLAGRIVDFAESVKKSTLDEQAKARALQGEITKLSMLHTWRVKSFGLVVVIGAMVALSVTNQLRGEAATLLGAVAGYLFAQRTKSDAG